MKIENHLLQEARCLLSPNFSDRPDPEDISLLVIHNISLPPNEFGGSFVEEFFLNRLDINAHGYFISIVDLKVSAHLFIRRTGEIVQFVPFDKCAWHAGISKFETREKCNEFSVGIELEGADTIFYEDVQYEKLTQVTKALQKNYPKITKDRIVGHCDIAPERKTDPGESFDWDRFHGAIQKS